MKKKPLWWSEIHQQALDKLTSKWVRLSDFTNRPEVARDLQHLGLIECKPEKRGQYTVLFWKVAA